MSFDVEVLFIARRLGYQIQEVPIDWYFDPDSRVRLFQDSLRMFTGPADHPPQRSPGTL